MKFEENELQADVIKALNPIKSVLAFHVANEANRSMQQAMRMKAIGLRSGVPDLVLVCSDSKTRYVELKTASGVRSKNQIRFADKLIEWDHDYACCRSVDEVMAALVKWGVIDFVYAETIKDASK